MAVFSGSVTSLFAKVDSIGEWLIFFASSFVLIQLSFRIGSGEHLFAGKVLACIFGVFVCLIAPVVLRDVVGIAPGYPFAFMTLFIAWVVSIPVAVGFRLIFDWSDR